MRISVFKRLLVFDNENEKKMHDLNVGDYFLYGTTTIAQKETKKVGQAITYYEVIDKSHGRIEYTPIFDYMEKDKGEEIK
jgi:hypothetical protein